MLEEYETNLDGLVLQDSTWNYKIPTLDTIPMQFNVQILNSGHHQHRVLSSKGMTQKSVLALVLFIFPHACTSLIHEKGKFCDSLLRHRFFILAVTFRNLGMNTQNMCYAVA